MFKNILVKHVLMTLAVAVLFIGAGILGFSAPLPKNLTNAMKASAADEFNLSVRPDDADAWLPRLQRNIGAIERKEDCHKIGEAARAQALVLSAEGKNEQSIEQYELATMMFFLSNDKEMTRTCILEAADRYEEIEDVEAAEEMRRAVSDSEQLPGE